MGVYVEIKLENGKRVGWMEIVREHALQPEHSVGPPHQPGEYEYRFRYNGGRGGVVAGAIFHNRADDVIELIRKVLNHSEPDPEYCQSCHCQFTAVEKPEEIPGDQTVYVRVNVPEWK